MEPPLGAEARRFFIALLLRVGHCTFPRFFAFTASLLLVILLPYNNAHAANVLAFDGVNDSIRKTSFSSGNFAQTRFSVELWFKSDAVNRGYLVQSANPSSSYDGEKIQYSMRLEAGGSVVANYGGKGAYVTVSSASSYGDDNWHHAAITLVDGSQFTLYIDGIAVDTGSRFKIAGTRFDALDVHLGVLTSTRFSNSTYFKGQMRDVRFWSDTRTAAEILANKDATLSGDEAGLFAWYTLDQGVGGGVSTLTAWIVDSTGGSTAQPRNFSMSGTTSNFVPFVDNSTPTVSGLPAAVTLIEDTKGEIDLSSALFDDADGDDLTLTLTASAGVFDTPADGAAGGVTETLVSSTVVTLAGSPAAINSYLDTAANLQYTPAANANGTAAATLTLQANDGTSTAALGTININITAVDDPVTLSGVPTSQTFTEDTTESITLSSIVAGDVDGDTLTMLLTLSAGEFGTPADGAGVSVTETRVSSSQVRLVGSASAINSYLDITDAIDYVPVADAFGTAAATLSLSLTDSVASTVTGSITFYLTGTNEAPVLRTGDVTDDRFVTAGDDDGDGSDGDDDATDNANNQGLTVAELLTLLDYSDADGAPDAKGIAIFRVVNPSSPSLGTIEYSTDNGGSWIEVTATRGTVTLTATALLLDGGSTGASTHRVRFNAKGAAGLTGKVHAYAWDKTVGTAGGTADASTVGGASAFSSGFMTVTFNARATAAPSISNLNSDIANYAIGAGPVAFDVGGDASVAHSGGGTFTNGTLDFSLSGISGQDSIRFATSLGVAVTSESTGGTVSVGGVDVGTFAGISDFVTRVRVTLNSDATLSRIDTLIRSLVYDNSSSTPTTSVRELLTSLTFDSQVWTTESYVRLVSIDLDATLTAATGVTEPVALPTTADTVGGAVDLLDFTLTDGGTADALALGVSQVVLNVSGTATDAQRGQITWRLNGPDASDVAGTYSAGADTITFSGLSISVADGASETYTVNAYFNDSANITDNATIALSVDGDTDLTASGTGMGVTTAATNGTGTLTTVAATKLAYATAPAGSASGAAFTTQPVVSALDAANNLDLDFTETITLSTSGGGSFSGDVDIAATAGVATFAGVAYIASADKESFTVSADDEATGGDLAAITSGSLSSEVTATRLLFQVQPTPRSAYSGDTVTFAPALTVAAVDSAGVVDSDYTASVTISETGGAGSVVFAFAGDTDVDEATVTMNAVAGLASFVGLSSRYSAADRSHDPR